MDATTKRKLLRASCHAAALCSWSVVVIGVPIGALIISNDPLVRDSAREAINYSISVIIFALVAVGLCFTIIGIPAAMLIFVGLAIATAILPILAIISVLSDPDARYRYPLTIRLLKSSDVTSV